MNIQTDIREYEYEYEYLSHTGTVSGGYVTSTTLPLTHCSQSTTYPTTRQLQQW